MFGFKKRKTELETQIAPIDQLDFEEEPSPKTEELISPEEEYTQASKKRFQNRVAGIVGLVILEVGALFGFANVSDTNNLHKRVLLEFESRNSGQVALQTGTYEGDTDFGYFVGEGDFSFNTGATYSGEWKDNLPHGVGTLQIPSEGTYNGSFLNGFKSGNGTFAWDDGSVYEGEWKNDQMCGQGIYTSCTGEVYTGTFADNTFWAGTCEFDNETGQYKLNFIDGDINTAAIDFTDGTHYSGECAKDSIYGSGTMTYPGGDQYTGAYYDGERNGEGKYQWPSEASYNGAWADDKMSGPGTYLFPNGNSASGTFEGNKFVDGTYTVLNDFGVYAFTIERGNPTKIDMTLENGTTYSGDLTDGKLTGNAQIRYSNGDTFSGTVSNGSKDGHGAYKWVSGASYDGAWTNDYMDGSGTYIYPSNESGYKLTGTFSYGKPNGKCQYYVSSYEKYETDWSNGYCVKVYE